METKSSNYKVTFKSHNGGCGLLAILTGENIIDAIKDHYTRKHRTKVISITEPYKSGEYHVEHGGRGVTIIKNREPIETIVTDDTIYDVTVIADSEG